MLVRTYFLIAVFSGFALFSAIDGAHAERRVALIVGNTAYQNVAPLPNPVNDAAAIAALLKKSGFDVVTARSNLGNLDFKRSLREFTLSTRNADIACCECPSAFGI
jgi:caspase domain-containing protein